MDRGNQHSTQYIVVAEKHDNGKHNLNASFKPLESPLQSPLHINV